MPFNEAYGSAKKTLNQLENDFKNFEMIFKASTVDDPKSAEGRLFRNHTSVQGFTPAAVSILENLTRTQLQLNKDLEALRKADNFNTADQEQQQKIQEISDKLSAIDFKLNQMGKIILNDESFFKLLSPNNNEDMFFTQDAEKILEHLVSSQKNMKTTREILSETHSPVLSDEITPLAKKIVAAIQLASSQKNVAAPSPPNKKRKGLLSTISQSFRSESPTRDAAGTREARALTASGRTRSDSVTKGKKSEKYYIELMEKQFKETSKKHHIKDKSEIPPDIKNKIATEKADLILGHLLSHISNDKTTIFNSAEQLLTMKENDGVYTILMQKHTGNRFIDEFQKFLAKNKPDSPLLKIAKPETLTSSSIASSTLDTTRTANPTLAASQISSSQWRSAKPSAASSLTSSVFSANSTLEDRFPEPSSDAASTASSSAPSTASTGSAPLSVGSEARSSTPSFPPQAADTSSAAAIKIGADAGREEAKMKAQSDNDGLSSVSPVPPESASASSSDPAVIGNPFEPFDFDAVLAESEANIAKAEAFNAEMERFFAEDPRTSPSDIATPGNPADFDAVDELLREMETRAQQAQVATAQQPQEEDTPAPDEAHDLPAPLNDEQQHQEIDKLLKSQNPINKDEQDKEAAQLLDELVTPKEKEGSLQADNNGSSAASSQPSDVARTPAASSFGSNSAEMLNPEIIEALEAALQIRAPDSDEQKAAARATQAVAPTDAVQLPAQPQIPVISITQTEDAKKEVEGVVDLTGDRPIVSPRTAQRHNNEGLNTSLEIAQEGQGDTPQSQAVKRDLSTSAKPIRADEKDADSNPSLGNLGRKPSDLDTLMMDATPYSLPEPKGFPAPPLPPQDASHSDGDDLKQLIGQTFPAAQPTEKQVSAQSSQPSPADAVSPSAQPSAKQQFELAKNELKQTAREFRILVDKKTKLTDDEKSHEEKFRLQRILLRAESDIKKLDAINEREKAKGKSKGVEDQQYEVATKHIQEHIRLLRSIAKLHTASPALSSRSSDASAPLLSPILPTSSATNQNAAGDTGTMVVTRQLPSAPDQPGHTGTRIETVASSHTNQVDAKSIKLSELMDGRLKANDASPSASASDIKLDELPKPNITSIVKGSQVLTPQYALACQALDEFKAKLLNWQTSPDSPEKSAATSAIKKAVEEINREIKKVQEAYDQNKGDEEKITNSDVNNLRNILEETINIFTPLAQIEAQYTAPQASMTEGIASSGQMNRDQHDDEDKAHLVSASASGAAPVSDIEGSARTSATAADPALPIVAERSSQTILLEPIASSSRHASARGDGQTPVSRVDELKDGGAAVIPTTSNDSPSPALPVYQTSNIEKEISKKLAPRFFIFPRSNGDKAKIITKELIAAASISGGTPTPEQLARYKILDNYLKDNPKVAEKCQSSIQPLASFLQYQKEHASESTPRQLNAIRKDIIESLTSDHTDEYKAQHIARITTAMAEGHLRYNNDTEPVIYKICDEYLKNNPGVLAEYQSLSAEQKHTSFEKYRESHKSEPTPQQEKSVRKDILENLSSTFFNPKSTEDKAQQVISYMRQIERFTATDRQIIRKTIEDYLDSNPRVKDAVCQKFNIEKGDTTITGSAVLKKIDVAFLQDKANDTIELIRNRMLTISNLKEEMKSYSNDDYYNRDKISEKIADVRRSLSRDLEDKFNHNPQLKGHLYERFGLDTGDATPPTSTLLEKISTWISPASQWPSGPESAEILQQTSVRLDNLARERAAVPTLPSHGPDSAPSTPRAQGVAIVESAALDPQNTSEIVSLEKGKEREAQQQSDEIFELDATASIQPAQSDAAHLAGQDQQQVSTLQELKEQFRSAKEELKALRTEMKSFTVNPSTNPEAAKAVKKLLSESEKQERYITIDAAKANETKYPQLIEKLTAITSDLKAEYLKIRPATAPSAIGSASAEPEGPPLSPRSPRARIIPNPAAPSAGPGSPRAPQPQAIPVERFGATPPQATATFDTSLTASPISEKPDEMKNPKEVQAHAGDATASESILDLDSLVGQITLPLDAHPATEQHLLDAHKKSAAESAQHHATPTELPVIVAAEPSRAERRLSAPSKIGDSASDEEKAGKPGLLRRMSLQLSETISSVLGAEQSTPTPPPPSSTHKAALLLAGGKHEIAERGLTTAVQAVHAEQEQKAKPAPTSAAISSDNQDDIAKQLRGASAKPSTPAVTSASVSTTSPDNPEATATTGMKR